MALTKEQWYNQLKSLYPKWFFEITENQKAHLQGFAGILAQVHSDFEDHFAESMITTANGDFLDMHGAERSIDRLPNEFDIREVPQG